MNTDLINSLIIGYSIFEYTSHKWYLPVHYNTVYDQNSTIISYTDFIVFY